MTHETNKDVDVTGEVSKTPKKGNFVPLAIIAAVIVLLLVAGGIFLWQHNSKSSTDTSNKKTAEPVHQLPASYKQSLKDELAAAQKGVAARMQATTPAEKGELANAYLDLGVGYMNTDQPDKAVDAYKKAMDTSADYKRKALGGLMYAYAANKQSAEAIKTCEELIALLKTIPESQDVAVSASIDKYQNELKALKNGEEL